MAVLAEAENLNRLQGALGELEAERIAVPPFAAEYLARGHAVHFRCRHPDAQGMRIDVMSVMRGVATFEELWQRRTTLEVEPGLCIELLSLPDLVDTKKTQRDKDWPMLRRLVEASYAQHHEAPTRDQVLFWLRQSRTLPMLLALARRYPDQLASVTDERPLLAMAASQDEAGLEAALELEKREDRQADQAYWAPLKAELEQLRHDRRKGQGGPAF